MPSQGKRIYLLTLNATHPETRIQTASVLKWPTQASNGGRNRDCQPTQLAQGRRIRPAEAPSGR